MHSRFSPAPQRAPSLLRTLLVGTAAGAIARQTVGIHQANPSGEQQHLSGDEQTEGVASITRTQTPHLGTHRQRFQRAVARMADSPRQALGAVAGLGLAKHQPAARKAMAC